MTDEEGEWGRYTLVALPSVTVPFIIGDSAKPDAVTMWQTTSGDHVIVLVAKNKQIRVLQAVEQAAEALN